MTHEFWTGYYSLVSLFYLQFASTAAKSFFLISTSFLYLSVSKRNFHWACSKLGFFSSPSSSKFSIGILLPDVLNCVNYRDFDPDQNSPTLLELFRQSSKKTADKSEMPEKVWFEKNHTVCIFLPHTCSLVPQRDTGSRKNNSN